MVFASRIEEIRVILGYDFAFAVDRNGRSGGLTLLCRHPFDCNIINYSLNFINAEITQRGRPNWRFTGFYGSPERSRRRESWVLLRTLARDNSLPWCTMGDYNDLLTNEDSSRDENHPSWLLRGFREAVLDSNIIDLPLKGYQFTWRRSREDLDTTKEGLDRALATQNWIDIFPRSRLINGVADRSDHSRILFKLYERERRVGHKPFRFENAWLEEPDLEMVVRDGWDRGLPEDLLMRLSHCTAELNTWGKKLRTKYRDAVEDL